MTGMTCCKCTKVLEGDQTQWPKKGAHVLFPLVNERGMYSLLAKMEEHVLQGEQYLNAQEPVSASFGGWCRLYFRKWDITRI